MTLTLYNTLTRAPEPFEPLEPGKVRVYGCGPTIYDHAHIGNFRSFMTYDLLHRYLEWTGHEVRFVMNLTDVDDRTIDRAAEAGVSIFEHTEPYADSFLSGLRTLGILEADVYPRATDYITGMVDLVRALVEKKHAYVAEDGSVYFSIGSFSDYGKLSRLDLDQVKPGARVAADDYGKDDVRDFALWKAAKDKDEKVGAAWDSPWGRGRPGWHLECSVMSLTELGETLDIHLGGEDLVFPHHEDEIAQSEAVTGKPFARWWVHVKHLRIDDRKMAKSLGNFLVLKELIDAGHEPAAIRHLLLSAHYRAELNFTLEGLEASANAVQRLLDFDRRLEDLVVDESAPPTGLADLAARALSDFRAAMDNDLNSAEALGAVFGYVGRVNALLDDTDAVPLADREAVLEAHRSMDRVLGIVEVARSGRSVDADTTSWVESLIEERKEARARRDFSRADAIRDELLQRGIVLEDTPGGTRWKVTYGGKGG